MEKTLSPLKMLNYNISNLQPSTPGQNYQVIVKATINVFAKYNINHLHLKTL